MTYKVRGLKEKLHVRGSVWCLHTVNQKRTLVISQPCWLLPLGCQAQLLGIPASTHAGLHGPIPESCYRDPNFAPRRSHRPLLALGRSRRRCCRRTRLPRCPHPSRSQRAPPAGQAQGPRRYYSPPRSPPSTPGAARQWGAGSGAFTLREEVTGTDTGEPPYWRGQPRPTQLHSCAHFAGTKTESPTGRGFLVCTEGSFGQL